MYDIRTGEFVNNKFNDYHYELSYDLNTYIFQRGEEHEMLDFISAICCTMSDFNREVLDNRFKFGLVVVAEKESKVQDE